MIDFIKSMFIKYKSFIMYAVFGVLATIVNIFLFWVFFNLLSLSTVISNVFSWILTCTFVYITNRIWVFESEEHSQKGIIKEIISFFVCRLTTLGVETVMLYVTIDLLKYNPMIMKVISNIVVIILNYVFSKLVIFKKKSK